MILINVKQMAAVEIRNLLIENYFVTGNLQKQLSDVLTRPEIWQSIQEQSSVISRSVTDIVNGFGHQALKEEGQFLAEKIMSHFQCLRTEYH